MYIKARLLTSVDADEFYAYRYGEGFRRPVDSVCSHFARDEEPGRVVYELEYDDAIDMVGSVYYARESADTTRVTIYMIER